MATFSHQELLNLYDTVRNAVWVGQSDLNQALIVELGKRGYEINVSDHMPPGRAFMSNIVHIALLNFDTDTAVISRNTGMYCFSHLIQEDSRAMTTEEIGNMLMNIEQVVVEVVGELMTTEEIGNMLMNYKPFGDQPQRYWQIWADAKILALTIQDCCPESREKSLALANLQQAVMWANASIAINEKETK